MELFLTYIIIVNIIGYVLMAKDKKKAEKKEWRIPEKTLFATAIIGGSIGIYLGMERYRHKTKHKSFTLGIPCILLIQGIVIMYLGKMLP